MVEKFASKRVAKQILGMSFIDQVLGPAVDGITEQYEKVLQKMIASGDASNIEYFKGELAAYKNSIELLRNIARNVTSEGD